MISTRTKCGNVRFNVLFERWFTSEICQESTELTGFLCLYWWLYPESSRVISVDYSDSWMSSCFGCRTSKILCIFYVCPGKLWLCASAWLIRLPSPYSRLSPQQGITHRCPENCIFWNQLCRTMLSYSRPGSALFSLCKELAATYFSCTHLREQLFQRGYCLASLWQCLYVFCVATL